jgi:hypothetical protein
MGSRPALLLAALVVAFVAADAGFGWGATVAASKWLFALIDRAAFWRYL